MNHIYFLLVILAAMSAGAITGFTVAWLLRFEYGLYVESVNDAQARDLRLADARIVELEQRLARQQAFILGHLAEMDYRHYQWVSLN